MGVYKNKPVKASMGLLAKILGMGGRKAIRMIKPDILAHYKKKQIFSGGLKDRGQLKNLKIKDYKNPSMKVVEE